MKTQKNSLLSTIYVPLQCSVYLLLTNGTPFLKASSEICTPFN